MLYNPRIAEPDTSYITAHAWRFLQLTPQQRLDWHTLFAEKMQVIEAMPHDTWDERRKRVLAGFLVWEEMERWTMESIAANIEAELLSQADANHPDQPDGEDQPC